MDDFISEYQWTIIEMISGILSVSFLFLVCSQIRIIEPVTFMSIDQTTQGVSVSYNIPVVEEGNFIVDNAIIERGRHFNWKDYIHVHSDSNESLLEYVSVSGDVDTQVAGEYVVTYTLHYNGTTIIKQATYYVKEVTS